MGYNYCLVIANKNVTKSVLSVLRKEKVAAELIKKSGSSDLVVAGNSLISYHGRDFPDLEKEFPGKTLTLYVDGRAASYEIQGNWDLALPFKAGISLQMGLSVKCLDLKKVKRDKKVAAMLKELATSDTLDDRQIDDDIVQDLHSVTVESERDLVKIENLSKIIENVSTALVEKEVEHYAAWFEGTFSKVSGDLHENLLYPVVYADAFWDEDGVEHQLHVTHTEIFFD